MRSCTGHLLGMALTGCSLVRVDPEIQAEYDAMKVEIATQTDAVRPIVEADLQALSAHPWMADRTCVHDASGVLHPLFGFDDQTYVNQGLIPRSSLSEPESDALGNAARKWRSAPEGSHWMTQGADPEVQAQALPWVATLRDFDCWNITAHSPWDEVDPLALDFSLPLPGNVYLGFASVILLMQLQAPSADSTLPDSERIQQTLEDVRRLATLCIQGQQVNMVQTGAQILDWEREAVEYLTTQGRMPVGWQVVSKADTDRLRRLHTIAPGFASFFTPPRHHDLITSESFAVGRCAGIREGTRTALMFQGLMEDEQLQWLHRVLNHSAALGCHHDDIRALRGRPEQHFANYEPFNNPLLPPAMRRSNAMVLATIAGPNYVGWTAETE